MSNDNNHLTKIILYGILGRRFGRIHYLAVSSAAEAVRALGSLLPGFDAFLTRSKDNGMGYAVFYGKHNLKKEELNFHNGDSDIRLAPILLGSKSGGWFNIILGAVLVIVGAVLTAYGGGGLGVPLMKLGVGLIVGGVVQLLTPVPKGLSARDSPENRPSYAFNGAVNTQAQGNPVPVLYGDLIVGSAVLSAGINAVDQAYIPGPAGAGSGGSGGGAATTWHNALGIIA